MPPRPQIPDSTAPRRVPLTVLSPPRPRWRPARWRTAALIALYLAIAAHITHWALTGRSMGRLVMSDSMKTLELGEVNPGFLLFAAALLLTLLFGRFFCGWACHMGALQDLCAWIKRRCGIRPAVFHSRVLGYVPLAMALYMFVWPSAKRLFFRTPEFPGFHAALTSERLWDGLPNVWVAIPFILLCGFGTVYFLGARGLCRYGCPYGGLLLPVEQLSPTRVVVNPNLCDQCGLCTAACTAGVRVHDDVRVFGRVVDKNCMKSLDCIAACPNDALSLGLAMPATPKGKPQGRPPRPVYDLSVGEECLALIVLVVTFFISRGLYGVVPMLMSGTLGVLTAFLAVMSLRVLRRADVRFRGLQLRTGRRLTKSGAAFLCAVAGLLLLVAHSGAVRALLWRASRVDDRVTLTFDQALAGHVTPEQRALATEGVRLFRLARGANAGGVALADTPEALVRLSWLELVAGDSASSAATLEQFVARGHAPDMVGVSLARVLLARGEVDRARTALERMVAGGRAPECRAFLAWIDAARGGLESALALLAKAPADERARARVMGERLHVERGLDPAPWLRGFDGG